MEDWFESQGVDRPGSQARHFARIVVAAIYQLRADKKKED